MQDLGILAGAMAAQGPGIELTITDTQHSVGAEVLVDAVEELRDAGAETMEVAGPDSALRLASRTPRRLVDGRPCGGRPYPVLAIGDPATMPKALQIPGGVVDTVDARPGVGASARRAREDRRCGLSQGVDSLRSCGAAPPD